MLNAFSKYIAKFLKKHVSRDVSEYCEIQDSDVFSIPGNEILEFRESGAVKTTPVSTLVVIDHIQAGIA